MHSADDLRARLIDIVSSSLFQQIAPFFALFLIPALVLLLASGTEQRTIFYQVMMGFENLGVLAPWRWLTNGGLSGSSRSSSHHHHRHHSRHLTKKRARTRSEQQANGSARLASDVERYYPGLVNISGTYCFMNSTLQALASLSYLQPHIDAIHEKAEILDVPTPIIDSLQHLLHRLNTPRSSYQAIRPIEVIDALTNVEGRSNALFYSREHQDAQELFQLLSECIKNEINDVAKEGNRDRGLSGLSHNPEATIEINKSIFDGLTANRRSCVICEYTEAVMHFSLDNLQLSLPRYAAACRLEDCLEEYTHLEILRDCVCRKCSLVATHRRLQHELAALEEATKPETNPSHSKKRRFKEVKRMEARVRSALGEGRIEDDLKDVRLERVISPATKQAMIARPPPVLALHINRSIHYGHYASKNSIRLVFPEILDITPYTTSGNLSIKPTSSISTPPPLSSSYSLPRRSSTPTPSAYSNHQPCTLYRLSAVVCHFGQHSFGHYICYRRKPRSASLPKEQRWAPPKLADPLLLHEESRTSRGPRANGNARPHPPDLDSGEPPHGRPRFAWDGEDPDEYGPGTGRGWLRISDDAVQECGIETVLSEGSGAFMLYYEKVVMGRLGVYPQLRLNSKEEKEAEVLDGEYAAECAAFAKYAAGNYGGARHSADDGNEEYAEGDMGTESEETLRPKTKTVVMNGSVDSLVSEVGVGVVTKTPKRAPSPPGSVASEPAGSSSSKPGSGLDRLAAIGRTFSVGPRVIRSVDAGRNLKRAGSTSVSSSAAPSPSSSLVLNSTTSSTAVSREQSTSITTESTVTPAPPAAPITPVAETAKSKSRPKSTPSRTAADSVGAQLGQDQDQDWEHVERHHHQHPNGNANVYRSFSLHSGHSRGAPSSSSHTTTSNPLRPQYPSSSPSPPPASSSPPIRHRPNTLKRKSKQGGSASGKKSAASASVAGAIGA